MKKIIVLTLCCLFALNVNAQVPVTDSILLKRVENLELINYNLHHNLSVFQKRKTVALSLFAGSIISNGLGFLALNNPDHSAYENRKDSKPLFIVGGALNLVATILWIDNFKWITPKQRNKH